MGNPLWFFGDFSAFRRFGLFHLGLDVPYRRRGRLDRRGASHAGLSAVAGHEFVVALMGAQVRQVLVICLFVLTGLDRIPN